MPATAPFTFRVAPSLGHLGRFPKLLGNFLKLLLERGRLSLLSEIGASYRVLLDEKLGRVPVTITTAVPVPEGEFRAWTDAIRGAVGGNAVVDHHGIPPAQGRRPQ